MSDLDYKSLARATRADLIDKIETQQKLNETQKGALDAAITQAAQKEAELRRERNKPVWFVASADHHINFAADRLGVPKNLRRYVNTNSMDGEASVRGARLTPRDVFLVRGWREGKYAREVERAFSPLFSLENCAWAPDPHFDFVSDGSYADKIIREAKYAGQFDVKIGSTLTIQGAEYTVTNMSLSASLDDAPRVMIDAVGALGRTASFSWNIETNEFVPKGSVYVINGIGGS